MSALPRGGECVPQLPNENVQRAIDYIRLHAARPLSVAELAAIAGLSVSRFIIVFRAHTGSPPHRFICEERVQRARALLERGVPSSRAAFDAGFADQSHLTRHFKRVCGITPAEYARNHRREEAR